MQALVSFMQKAPKAELHLHIEGTLEPELMFALARRNSIDLPYASADEIRDKYNFSSLQDFLDIYYQGMAVLVEERDFFDLSWAYLQKAADDNIIHSEIFFDPQAHLERGVGFEVMIGGITRALDKARCELGVTSRLIMCFLRHLSESDAFATLKEAEPYLEHIAGAGLDSSEKHNPPAKFVNVFSRARELGLKCTAHAGEEGPAEYIRQAIELLKAKRIDHGNAVLDDAQLCKELAAAGTVFTLCPLSNLKLGVIGNMKAHPVKKMLTAGLSPMINSDDPAYFGGYVNANYEALITALDLDYRDITTLLHNSFAGAFMNEAERGAALGKLEDYLASEGPAQK